MPDVQPFRGWRYELSRVGALSDVVAPPYDVVDAGLQQTLYDRNPYNVIRLELNKPEPTDDERTNRYTRAARFLKDWQRDGVLRQDDDATFYVYHQTYTVEGKEYLRKGLLARVRLERFGEGKIYAHEETMSGPKADRLKLFHATGMNLSPIFGLYPDPDNTVQSQLDEAVRRTLPLEATDHLGVVSRIWPLAQPRIATQVQQLLFDKAVFIADGHHRYETSIRYRDDLVAAGRTLTDDDPANFVMMMLVSMSDPGLRILPTHRLLSGLPNLNAAQLGSHLATHFELETIGAGPQAARDLWTLIEADGSQDVLGFGTVADGVWQLARLREPEAMAKLAAEHSSAWQSLAVSILHVLVLNHLLQPALGVAPQCSYVHLVDEVLAAVDARQCQVAVLVPPATMEHVELIAGNLEKMPAKSTYFYPKLLTGLVLNPIR